MAKSGKPIPNRRHIHLGDWAHYVRRWNGTELYRRALSDDPENTDALDALADIAERDGRWPLACDLLERRFATELDATRRAQIALRAGPPAVKHADQLELDCRQDQRPCNSPGPMSPRQLRWPVRSHLP